MARDVRSYRDLEVWKEAMELVAAVYRMTRSCPKSEMFGLTSQLRRAAVSIPANLAEGNARESTKAFLNHISIAYGSLSELETHVEIALRLDYVTTSVSAGLQDRMNRIGRMLNGLRRALRARTNPRSPTSDPRSPTPDPRSP